MKTVQIKDLFNDKSNSFEDIQVARLVGDVPKHLYDKGITISVAVPYPMFASESKKREANLEAYNSIQEHRSLFTFVMCYGVRCLEDLRDSASGSWYLWVRIGHICDNNCLILTHSHGPNRTEAYYQAKDYNDFWKMVEKITEVYERPNEPHEPIILKQNNMMIGSGYREWTICVE